MTIIFSDGIELDFPVAAIDHQIYNNNSTEDGGVYLMPFDEWKRKILVLF